MNITGTGSNLVRRRPARPVTVVNPRTAGGIDTASLIVIVVVLLAIGVAGFFIYRGNALKSEMAQVRENADQQRVELEGQVKAANAKAREATDKLTESQTQVDLARAEAATAKSNASSQIAAMQTQLEQAKRQAANASANAQKLSAELAKLKTELQEQAPVAAPVVEKPVQPEPAPAVKTEASSLNKLPLNVSFKKAPLGDSNALALQNTSNNSLSLAVKFSNPSDSKEVQVKLDPGAAREIGWLGAWVLASGDKVEIKSQGYASIVRTAP